MTPGSPYKRSHTPTGIVLSTRAFPRITWTDRNGTHDAIVQKRMVVGASDAADLVIDDQTVSRVHAELDPRDDGLWVRDLDSRNGTFVNGGRVREICVRGRGELRVGTTEVTYDYDAGTVAPVELWPGAMFHHMVGRSAAMRELFALLARVGPTEASLLINGETGTGKEVVARTIHDASKRRDGPYVVVDCAALPENLLDAELFGHTKGAFTGALAARAGAIESADGGTVFLDEIGELPMAMQPKLLRVIEQRTVRRIGESSHRPVNVRFVSATHRDLLSMVSRGEFREDLYFRMCVITLQVPPLRNRREDIVLLVEHFLQGERLSPELMKEMTDLPWRGNVRELRNFVERTRALGEQQVRNMTAGAVRTRGAEDEPAPRSVPRVRGTMPPPGTGTSPGKRGKFAIPNLHDVDESEESGTTPINIADQTMFPIPRAPRAPSDHEMQSPSPPPAAAAVAEITVRYEGSFKIFRERWIEHGEREYLRFMLEKHQRNVPALAKEADVDRTYIYRLMKKYGL